ncbi:damage-control phosphatase ARMT1 [Daphnia magna]|uniref:Sugar phosphate phosphatase n=2 Tax=Daphnia magna TaxID=35525 RepID=A0A0P5W7R7_9CRUS|nr:damage-control phosphatase ARMT1 [Daphnia magna]KAK4037897.1 hypothetical protein OUZ56_029922 [Daphnia magna]KZS02859.1 Glutamate O-methyltransferase [Daphnia magna]
MTSTFGSCSPYPYLSAGVPGSFAYRTVKDRMPVILTKVIDFLCRNKHEILESSTAEAGSIEDLKLIIGKLSQLRSEMQTNKTLRPLEISSSHLRDGAKWNNELIEAKDSSSPQWFSSPWLLVECYMYRAIYCIFENSIHLKRLDPFSHMKEELIISQKYVLSQLVAYTNDLSQTITSASHLQANFMKLLEISLWANRNDLSLSGGNAETKPGSFLDDVEQLSSHILVNNANELWLYVEQVQKDFRNKELGIIMDNSGLEMVADLCLAVYCISHQLFDRVIFYVKKIPWFVSDTTFDDLQWALHYMEKDVPEMQCFASKCLGYLDSQQFQVVEEGYFTLPLPYHVMNKEDPDLYNKLSQSQLLIFKGDLNYRKLGADIDWPSTTTFEKFLQGFKPAPLVALRTIKAEIICDIPSTKVSELELLDKDWMTKGDYGLIQFIK